VQSVQSVFPGASQEKKYLWSYTIPFMAILAAKLAIAGLFSSDYQDKLFIPFITYFVGTLQNPWEHFYLENSGVSFPYQPLMLYIFSPFAWIISAFDIRNIFLVNLIFKLPLIIADYSIFYIMALFLPGKQRYIMLLYLLSPIILYATYIHAQFDLIPTALLFASIYLLTRKRIWLSSLFFGCALLTKVHVLAALPLIVIFLYRNKKYKEIVYFLGLAGGLFLAGIAPYLNSQGFISLVLQNPEQFLMFENFYVIGNYKIYVVIFGLVGVYGKFWLYKRINNDLFISYANIVFVALLLLVYPVPSWYIWITPYLYIFLVNLYKERWDNIIIYILFSIIYLSFFLLFYHHPFQEIVEVKFLGMAVDTKLQLDSKALEMMSNINFTLLETFLIALGFLAYSYSVRSNRVYSSLATAPAIGIAGDSGVGKSSLLADIKSLLGVHNIVPLEGDGEHKWARGDQNWQKFTHLDPRANFLHQQMEYLRMLKVGIPISRREYDHDTGSFTQERVIKPKDYIIISGLHAFYLPMARKYVDIKIYLDTDDKLRQHWKILRDSKTRGYSAEKVIEQMKIRAIDREKYIIPQKELADLVLAYSTEKDFTPGDVNAKPELRLAVELSANINLEDLYQELNLVESITYNYDYSQDLHHQQVSMSGAISGKQVKKIAEKIIVNLHELLDEGAVWNDGMRGMAQLFVMILLSATLRDQVSSQHRLRDF
jgi:uridine kinase